MDPRENEKRAAAEAAAAQVQSGTTLGLGTGTTVGHFLAALARRGVEVTCVATSIGTEEAARAIGLAVQPFDLLDSLDLAVDGADQVVPDLWAVKGRGGAHTREKVVAAAARRFVIIASSDKLVERLQPPVPVEVLAFGVAATIRRLEEMGPVQRRPGPLTPDANILVDYMGPVDDPAVLGAALDADPGVVAHGLFPPSMVDQVLVGQGEGEVRSLPEGIALSRSIRPSC